MNSLVLDARHSAALSAADQAAAELIDAWQHGVPSLDEHWARYQDQGSVLILAALVKADLRCRFAQDQMVAVADYLERYPALRQEDDRVVSLVYEEFCLREDRGEAIDPDSFCGRYEPWRDSLASQLRYHRLLTQVGKGASTPPKFPELGDRFLGFHLRRLLGQGGAARVYLADDEELGGLHRALKVSPDRGEEPSIMGRLDHRHIVPVLSVARDPASGLRGLCMPYQPGQPLDEVLRRMADTPPPARTAQDLWNAAISDDPSETADPSVWQSFPQRGTYPQAAAWIVAALAEALEHAHTQEILHRDVKPANILLTRKNGPQLLDFNLAYDPHSVEGVEAALRGGTLPYMAPEQLHAFLDAECWDDVGPEADGYALGLVLFELLTGVRPEVPGADLPLPRAIQELLDRRAEGPRSLRDFNPLIPHALDAITRRCLAPRPEDRYPSAQALADDLRCFLERRPLVHVQNPSPCERMRNWAWRRRKVFAAAMLVLTAALLIWNVAGSPTAASMTKQAARHLEAGQLEMADQTIQQAQQLDPTFKNLAPFLRDLGSAYYEAALQAIAPNNDRLKQPDRFRAYIARATELGYPLDRNDAKSFMTAAQLYNWDIPEQRSIARGLAIEAQRIDPQLYSVYHALGTLDMLDQRFEKSVQYMDAAIEHAAYLPDNTLAAQTLKQNFLAILHQARAMVRVEWARNVFGKDDWDHSESLYQEAQRDLEWCDAHRQPENRQLETRLLSTRANLHKGLADLAEARSQNDLVRHHDGVAEAIFESLLAKELSPAQLENIRHQLGLIHARGAAAGGSEPPDPPNTSSRPSLTPESARR